MNAQQFLAEFGHIANAPGAIEQLREMVYQLAITGSLTPQRDTDGDACQLLADIAILRDRLILGKAYKRLPNLENEALDIPSFIELPSSWCWTRLLDIGEISPKNDVPDETAASFIPMRGFSEIHMGALAPEVAKWRNIKKGFTHFRNGDVVVAKITPCFENGKAAVIDGLEHGIGAGTTELHVFRPIHTGILPGYIYLFLRSPYFAVEGEKNMTGTAGQKRLPTEYFATRALPLPPSAEQYRIVAKVDELMALCDKLETQQQDRRKLQNNLRQSTLQVVASSQSSHELQTNWARLANNFGRLFHAPEDVADLRATIFSLAVRGFLTDQISSEEPAEIQLTEIKKISAFKQDQGRRRSKVSYRSVEDEDLAYLIPSGWSVARLGELVRVINGRAYSKDELLDRGTPVLRVGNLFTSRNWYYSDLELEEDKYCETGDLIFAWSASFGPFIWSGPRVIYHYHIWKLESFSDEFLNKQFLYTVLLEQTKAIKASGHGISMAHMTKEKMEQLPIALPPLAEQARIVLKVAALMKICDQLEEKLRDSNEIAARLAVSAIATVAGITMVYEEDEPMKAPQTELIAPLSLGVLPDVKDQAPLATILARHNGEISAKDLWQRFGGEIDSFYAQLKTEVAHGWILEPAIAKMSEKQSDTVNA